MKKIMTNLEKLRTGTPEQITEMFCHEYLENCSACSHFVRECCNGGKNGFEEWLKEEAKTQKEEAKTQKDAPRGWIKLKAIVNADDDTLYIKASTIVSIGHSINVNTIDGKRVTAVYTLYAEDDPWLVYDSIDEVMEKIEKA